MLQREGKKGEQLKKVYTLTKYHWTVTWAKISRGMSVLSMELSFTVRQETMDTKVHEDMTNYLVVLKGKRVKL